MGIILIAILLIIFGLIGLKYSERSSSNFWVEDVSIVGIILGAFALGICLVIIGAVQFPNQTNYHNTEYEKSLLEYRLETENLEGNELLYSDILKFNKSLFVKKVYAHNFMTNWFVNKRIADGIDYILIDGVHIPMLN